MNKKVLLTLIAVVAAMTAMAQGRLDLRINEVMVQNDSNYVDQDGHRSAWIEIFNASHSTNAIEKMFITTYKQDFIQNYFKEEEQKSNKKRNQLLNELAEKHGDSIYVIPRGDVDTKVGPRTHVVFFADGKDADGTFHLPFKLEVGKDNYIALYDVNGDLVDEVIVPADLPANQSFARISEENIDLHKKSRDFDKAEWQMCDGSDSLAITPAKFNARPINENIQKFKDEDPSGILLTLMSMGVVFSALLLLYILFKLFGKAFAAKDKKKDESGEERVESGEVPDSKSPSDDEAIAAICMALYQHFNAHDEESGVITIDHSHEAHSAWGSKGNLLLHKPEHHENH